MTKHQVSIKQNEIFIRSMRHAYQSHGEKLLIKKIDLRKQQNFERVFTQLSETTKTRNATIHIDLNEMMLPLLQYILQNNPRQRFNLYISNNFHKGLHPEQVAVLIKGSENSYHHKFIFNKKISLSAPEMTFLQHAFELVHSKLTPKQTNIPVRFFVKRPYGTPNYSNNAAFNILIGWEDISWKMSLSSLSPVKSPLSVLQLTKLNAVPIRINLNVRYLENKQVQNLLLRKNRDHNKVCFKPDRIRRDRIKPLAKVMKYIVLNSYLNPDETVLTRFEIPSLTKIQLWTLLARQKDLQGSSITMYPNMVPGKYRRHIREWISYLKHLGYPAKQDTSYY